MEFLSPVTLNEALSAKAERPEALPIAGGTDVMLGLNFGRLRPAILVDLLRVPELTGVVQHDGWLRIGAATTYTDAIRELRELAPALVTAARGIASHVLRNRATIGGNLGTASPAGDCHPVLLACVAEVEALSASRGSRRIPADAFFVGPNQNALEPDELIAAIWLPLVGGRQVFAKVGRRNAMATSVCSFALSVNREGRAVGTGIGAAGPTPLRAPEAERFLEGVLNEGGLWDSAVALPTSALAHFGDLVAAAARPIDDVRGSAAYRRHALSVLARRALVWSRNGGHR